MVALIRIYKVLLLLLLYNRVMRQSYFENKMIPADGQLGNSNSVEWKKLTKLN